MKLSKPMVESTDHAVFVKKYRANQIAVDVDKNKAGFLYDNPALMPRALQKKQALIRAIAFGGVLIGTTFFFFAPWCVALGVLLIGLYMFPQAQNAAAADAIEASLKDPDVYQVAVKNGVILIREVT